MSTKEKEGPGAPLPSLLAAFQLPCTAKAWPCWVPALQSAQTEIAPPYYSWDDGGRGWKILVSGKWALASYPVFTLSHSRLILHRCRKPPTRVQGTEICAQHVFVGGWQQSMASDIYARQRLASNMYTISMGSLHMDTHLRAVAVEALTCEGVYKPMPWNLSRYLYIHIHTHQRHSRTCKAMHSQGMATLQYKVCSELRLTNQS